MTIQLLEGHGPAPGDMPMMGRNLYFPSTGRVLLENLAVSRGNSSSTLPARKWLIPLEADFKAQTTNCVFPGQKDSVVLTPMQQIATSGRG